MRMDYFDALEATYHILNRGIDHKTPMLIMALIHKIGIYQHNRIEHATTQVTGTIPLPPSVNTIHSTNKKTGGRMASKVLAEYKRAVMAAGSDLARLSYIYHRDPLPPGQVYRLTLNCYFETDHQIRASDADGRIKAAQDVIMQALGVDDKWIYSVTVNKAGADPFNPRADFALEILHGDQLEAGLISPPARKVAE